MAVHSLVNADVTGYLMKVVVAVVVTGDDFADPVKSFVDTKTLLDWMTVTT
jgi:hypothetical protein